MSALPAELSLALLAYIAVVFIAGGLVKGVAGFGLPLTTVPLLALVVPLPTAVAWTLIPLMVSQVAQLIECRRGAGVLRTIWPLMAGLGIALVLSVRLLAIVDPRTLMTAVGALILVFVASQLLAAPLQLPVRRRGGILALAGLVTGAIGGVTSFYGFPTVQVLLALGLRQAEFIFATSATFFVGGAILAAGLKALDLVRPGDIALSIAAVVPVMVGLGVGGLVRNRLSLRVFRACIYAVLTVSGAAMIVRGLL